MAIDINKTLSFGEERRKSGETSGNYRKVCGHGLQHRQGDVNCPPSFDNRKNIAVGKAVDFMYGIEIMIHYSYV